MSYTLENFKSDLDFLPSAEAGGFHVSRRGVS